jgi:hypothetical protein
MHRFDKEKQAQVQSEHAANIESSQMDAEVDPARSLDALIVFVWWEEERRGLTFHPPLGLAHCHTHLLAKGHIQRVRVSKYQSEQQDWYAVHKMKEGTGENSENFCCCTAAPSRQWHTLACVVLTLTLTPKP